MINMIAKCMDLPEISDSPQIVEARFFVFISSVSTNVTGHLIGSYNDFF